MPGMTVQVAKRATTHTVLNSGKIVFKKILKEHITASRRGDRGCKSRTAIDETFQAGGQNKIFMATNSREVTAKNKVTDNINTYPEGTRNIVQTQHCLYGESLPILYYDFDQSIVQLSS